MKKSTNWKKAAPYPKWTVPCTSLGQEEELSLIDLAKKGNVDAKHKLVFSHMPLIWSIAAVYAHPSLTMDDLVQEGIIGLLKAISKFDETRKHRFSTYAAHWVRQSIARAVDDKARSIRLPSHAHRTLKKVEMVRRMILKEYGYEPTLEQIAMILKINPTKLRSYITASQETVSLDHSLHDSEIGLNNPSAPESSSESPDARVLHSELKRCLHEMIDSLNEREKRIISCRLEGSTQQNTLRRNLAKEFRVTQERVRQIEVKAIQKMRNIAECRQLTESSK